MRFICVSPSKEKTVHIIENEMIVADFVWVNDSNKIAELNEKITAAGFPQLTAEEIIEIDRHLILIEEDKKSVE
jgi:hypothetical protein